MGSQSWESAQGVPCGVLFPWREVEAPPVSRAHAPGLRPRAETVGADFTGFLGKRPGPGAQGDGGPTAGKRRAARLSSALPPKHTRVKWNGS